MQRQTAVTGCYSSEMLLLLPLLDNLLCLDNNTIIIGTHAKVAILASMTTHNANPQIQEVTDGGEDNERGMGRIGMYMPGNTRRSANVDLMLRQRLRR